MRESLKQKNIQHFIQWSQEHPKFYYLDPKQHSLADTSFQDILFWNYHTKRKTKFFDILNDKTVNGISLLARIAHNQPQNIPYLIDVGAQPNNEPFEHSIIANIMKTEPDQIQKTLTYLMNNGYQNIVFQTNKNGDHFLSHYIKQMNGNIGPHTLYNILKILPKLLNMADHQGNNVLQTLFIKNNTYPFLDHFLKLDIQDALLHKNNAGKSFIDLYLKAPNIFNQYATTGLYPFIEVLSEKQNIEQTILNKQKKHLVKTHENHNISHKHPIL